MHIDINFLTSRRIPGYFPGLLFIFLLYSTPAYPETSPTPPWYIGREICMPIFFGNLKTQLHHQKPASLQYGLSIGYKLHRFFRLELSVDYGNSRLTARPADREHLLDRHGKTHLETSSSGTVPYSQIYTQLKYAGAGIHIPFNLSRLFSRQSDPHRLTILLSPGISVNRYKSKLRLKYFHQNWLSPKIHWSFDLGTDLLLRYALSNRIDFQLRSGIKYISNKKFDGLSTSSPHNTSYVWTSGISLLYKFGKNLLFHRE